MHLEVCEVFETCRSAEHMTYAELQAALEKVSPIGPEARLLSRIAVDRVRQEPVHTIDGPDDDFLRKARAT